MFLLQAGHVYFRYKVFAPLLEDDEAGFLFSPFLFFYFLFFGLGIKDNPGFRFFVDSNEVMMSQSTDYRFVH